MIVLWIALLFKVSLASDSSCYSSLEPNLRLPPIRIIRNSSDSQMADLSCLLHRLGNVSEVIETTDRPCVQLLTLSAEPYELDILMIRAEVNLPLCEPRVYGPLPRVLQARFAPENTNSFGPKNVVSFQLNSRGGHLLFDLNLDKEHDLMNLALRNILELVELTREGPTNASSKSFKNFQRKEDFYANPAMTKEIFEMKYKQRKKVSIPSAYFFGFASFPLLLFASFGAYLLLWDPAEEEKSIETTQTESEPLLDDSEKR